MSNTLLLIGNQFINQLNSFVIDLYLRNDGNFDSLEDFQKTAAQKPPKGTKLVMLTS